MPWKINIVGRVSEVAQVEAEWRRAAAGQFRCVLLLGEPGMGKTRLAAEILEARRRGSLDLSARAHQLGGTASFGLWAEALEGHLRGLPAQAVERLCGGLLDDLASLLRSVAAVRGAAPSREPPRARLMEGLAVLFDNLSRQAPVLVVLDDAHLADASSWDALHYLAGSFPEAPILVIATARPADLAGQSVATRVLFDLEQEGMLTRVKLEPLGPRAVHDLAEAVIGMAPPRALVEWLSERARGNPLFALGLLQALLDEQADLAAPALSSVPESLSERVRSRVALLDPDAQSVLEVLAVLGRRAELGDLIGLAGRPLDQLDVVLERLVRAGLVLEEQRAPKLAYEIAHPLIQETIYEHVGGARRLTLHRQVGRALLTLERLGEAAPHFARSGEVGDPEAIAVLRDALRQAEEREAYREGLEILGALVELLPSGDDRWLAVADALQLEAEWVLDHRADLHATRGIQALQEIDRVLAQCPDPARQARVKSRLTSFFSWGTGEFEEAERICRDAIALFEVAGDRRHALLSSLELAYIRGIGGDLPALESGAREVLSAAEAAGDRYATLHAIGVTGIGAFYQGHFSEAEAALQRSTAMAREDGKLYRLNWSLMSLGWLYGFQGHLGAALEAFAEAKAVNPSWRDSNVLEIEAHVHWLAGNFRSSLACMSEVLAFNPGVLSRRRGLAAVCAAMSAAEVGRLGQARDFLEMARSAYEDRNFFFIRPLHLHAEALLAWRDGEPAAALALLGEATDELDAMRARAFAAVVVLDWAEVAARSDRPEVADAAARRLAELAADSPEGLLHQGVARLAAAWADLANERWEAAETAAGEAKDLLSPLGYRVLVGRALDSYGRIVAREDRGGALEALQEAGAVFDSIHATWRRDQVIESLRDLGVRGRRAAGAVLGPASLTVREREVARLAAQRLTAREIADLLFISERTVEGHLANVYAKLGVRSKPDFARRASEFGLT